MEQRNYYIVLYDFYGNLLSEKQKEYFEYYYFDNLSLGEISENLNISRNAIHKSLKKIEQKLEEYEEKLQLYKKRLELAKILEKVDISLRKEIERVIE